MTHKDHDNKYRINLLTIHIYTNAETLLYSYKICTTHFKVCLCLIFTETQFLNQEIYMCIITFLDFSKIAVKDHILGAHIESQYYEIL
jgi:hypothetical protein